MEEGEKGRVWLTGTTVPSPPGAKFHHWTAQLEGLCFLVISQGTAAVPALREVRSPGWNLAQSCALCKERSCPDYAGLCKETAALKELQHPLWTDKRLLTSANTYPSLHLLPSVRPGSNPLHTPSIRERQLSLLGGVIPASFKHRGSTRRLTSSAWPGRSIASFFILASQTFSVLSLLPLTSKRLSADQAIWYTAETCPLSDVRYLVRRRHEEAVREACSQFVPNLPLPSFCGSSPPVSKQAQSRGAQHTARQHAQGSQLL